MKYFVTSDVHSFYTLLKKALDEAGFDINNPEHIFVHCGDLLDRGDMPRNCLKFVNSLPEERKILIRGNHEDLIEACIVRKEFHAHDYHNGTVGTMLDLGLDIGSAYDGYTVFANVKHNDEYKTYIKSLRDFAEVGDYIFVHGWIPCGRDDDNKYHARDIHYTFDEAWKDGDWDAARWINGMEAWHQGVRIPGKTIVCGHWHSSFGNSKYHNDGLEFPNTRSTNPAHRYANFEPFIDDGIIAVDACTAFSHRVNCVVIEA